MDEIKMYRAWAAGGAVGIDRAARVINGVAVITKGLARTHGEQIDDTTLDQVVELGNRGPIKSRFGHPGEDQDPIGSVLGEFVNFRRDGDVVRADLRISALADKSPKYPGMGTYVLDLAEAAPEKCGASIVFAGYREGSKGVVYARVRNLMAVDITDTPAANPSGIFSIRPDGQRSFSMADEDEDKKKKEEETKLSTDGDKKEEVTPLSADEIKQCRAMMAKFSEQGGDSNATQKDITTQHSQKTSEVIALSAVDLEKARAEGREAERKYSIEFDGVMTAAQFKAEDREKFRKEHYGVEIATVKKFATIIVESRTKAVGEGGATAQTDGGTAGDPDAIKRFSEIPSMRRNFGVTNDDPKSEEYQKGLQRYLKAIAATEAKK